MQLKSYESHACSLSQQNLLCRSLKLAVTRKLGLQKSFCLLRMKKHVFQQNRQAYVKASHERKSWNNFKRKCCPVLSCPDRLSIKVETFSQWWSIFKEHNTTQNQPKTYSNQPTSCKFCSSTAQLSPIHTHGPACIASFHSPPIFSGCMRSFWQNMGATSKNNKL